MTEFEKLGGLEMLQKISKIFYDKVYAHPWIGKFFQSVKQEIIEAQQVDFMAAALGGPDRYNGKIVPVAHAHMMITEELFQLREDLLNEAFVEAKASQDLKSKWNKIDRAFKSKVVKQDISECKQRYHDEPVVDFKKPTN